MPFWCSLWFGCFMNCVVHCCNGKQLMIKCECDAYRIVCVHNIMLSRLRKWTYHILPCVLIIFPTSMLVLLIAFTCVSVTFYLPDTSLCLDPTLVHPTAIEPAHVGVAQCTCHPGQMTLCRWSSCGGWLQRSNLSQTSMMDLAPGQSLVSRHRSELPWGPQP